MGKTEENRMMHMKITNMPNISIIIYYIINIAGYTRSDLNAIRTIIVKNA